MAATKYLDQIGLAYFWGKIKDYVHSTIVTSTSVLELNTDTAVTTTSTYADTVILVLKTSGITITLPTCSSAVTFFIKNGTNAKCYVACATGVTVDGSNDIIDLDPYGYIRVTYSGTANSYLIIGGSI